MALVEVRAAPKGRHWKVTIDHRTLSEPVEEILDWLKRSCRRDAYWTRILFRDRTTGLPFAPSMQRKFSDGYYVLVVWFVSKSDAALFRLWWDR